MKRLRAKYVWLTLCSFLSCVTPTVLAITMNWTEYTSHGVEEALRICVGLGILWILLLKRLIGDKPMGQLSIAVWLFVICWLLSSMALDLPMLSATWLIGRTSYYIFFETAYGRVKAQYRKEKAHE